MSCGKKPTIAFALLMGAMPIFASAQYGNSCPAAVAPGNGVPAAQPVPAPSAPVAPSSDTVSATQPPESTSTTVAPEGNAPAATSPSTLERWLAPTSLSGLVDAYYDYNFDQPFSHTSGFRSFDVNSGQLDLNLLELAVDKTPDASNGRIGYHFALGFGEAMNAVNGPYTSEGFSRYVKEAYFSYLAPVGTGLQTDAGKFVTPAGAEVIETKDNWNYSRGLLFSYAIPYFHFGLRSKYAFNSKYSVYSILVDGWNSILGNNAGKTYGAGFGWNPTKKFSLVQNYMTGPEEKNNTSNWRQLSDTVVTYSPTAKLSLMANYDYSRGDRIADVVNAVFWTGIAGYVKYTFNPKYAMATRYEYFDDHNGFTTGRAQNLQEYTTTFQRIIASHTLTYLEFRRDFSNEPTFTKGDNLPVTTQSTMTAGLVFALEHRRTE